jgi:uncharacterized membrane protein
MSRRSKHYDAHHPPEAPGSAPDHSFTHRMTLPPEKFFRWRGGEITRLEAFCDVVFGFALTLLVVSLEVPHSYSELITDMRGFIPFAICFSQLVMIWLTHYKFSRRYGLEDSYTVFLNMVLLFLVLLYVYPLKFVFSLVFSQLTGGVSGSDLTLHQASVMMEIYAVGFASVFLLFTLMYLHAYRLRDKLELSAIEALETQATMQSCAILSLIGFVSLLIAVRHPEWAGWLFLVIGPALTIHGMLYGRRIRALKEKSAAS